MATIVDTLFGVSPERLDRERAAAADARALAFAKLDPFQQANFAIGRGASGLAGAIGGALGGQDPELQRVTMRQQLLGTIDPSRPETFDLAAQAAEQAGDTQLAFGLRLEAPKYRQQAQTALATQQAELLTQQTAAQEQRAAQLVGQLKNADGTVNQAVLSELQTFPQGMAAIKTQADILPAIRRLGAVGSQEIDPFAILINDATIPQNVKTLAKQYSASLASGNLDPEKSDIRFKELVEMTQRIQQNEQNQAQIKLQQEQLNEFRRQGLANSQAALQLAQSTKALQEQNAQAERDRKEEERKNKPLPPNLQKQEEDDFQLAQATSNLAMDANNFINRIKRGEIKFGLKDRATISTMSLFGSNDPDVLARQDYDKFVARLTSENLRLNKGVQTDKDFERELNLLKSAESAGSAAQIMKNLVDINLRKTADAAKSIERRRNNAGFAPPRTPIDLPILDIQIITPTEEKSFLANPKFPEGTVYINPQGIRTVKTLKR